MAEKRGVEKLERAAFAGSAVALSVTLCAVRAGVAPGCLPSVAAFLAVTTLAAGASVLLRSVLGRRAAMLRGRPVPEGTRLKTPYWMTASDDLGLVGTGALLAAVAALVGFVGVGVGILVAASATAIFQARQGRALVVPDLAFEPVGLRVYLSTCQFLLPWSAIADVHGDAPSSERMRVDISDLDIVVGSVHPSDDNARGKVRSLLTVTGGVHPSLQVLHWAGGLDPETLGQAIRERAALNKLWEPPSGDADMDVGIAALLEAERAPGSPRVAIVHRPWPRPLPDVLLAVGGPVALVMVAMTLASGAAPAGMAAAGVFAVLASAAAGALALSRAAQRRRARHTIGRLPRGVRLQRPRWLVSRHALLFLGWLTLGAAAIAALGFPGVAAGAALLLGAVGWMVLPQLLPATGEVTFESAGLRIHLRSASLMVPWPAVLAAMVVGPDGYRWVHLLVADPERILSSCQPAHPGAGSQLQELLTWVAPSACRIRLLPWTAGVDATTLAQEIQAAAEGTEAAVN